MQPDFRPITEAQAITFGTVADLRMPSGRIYRAVWGFRGRCCAWWPLPGQVRRKPIGLYEPTAFAVIATGGIAQPDWQRASELQHAVEIWTPWGNMKPRHLAHLLTKEPA